MKNLWGLCCEIFQSELGFISSFCYLHVICSQMHHMNYPLPYKPVKNHRVYYFIRFFNRNCFGWKVSRTKVNYLCSKFVMGSFSLVLNNKIMELTGAWSASRSNEEGSCTGSEEDWFGKQRIKTTRSYLPEEGKSSYQILMLILLSKF